MGAEARVVPAAFPDKTLSGTVDQVAIAPRQLAGQNKSYPVRIRLANTEGVVFHPGMSCRAEILTGEQGDVKLLAVPVQAVRYEDNPDKSSKEEKSLASVFVYGWPRHQARRQDRHRGRYLHRHHDGPEGRRADRRGPGEDAAVPDRRREGELNPAAKTEAVAKK